MAGTFHYMHMEYMEEAKKEGKERDKRAGKVGRLLLLLHITTNCNIVYLYTTDDDHCRVDEILAFCKCE